MAGVSAAGDVSGRMPSVANAIAAGSSAAAMIVHGLMAELRRRQRSPGRAAAGAYGALHVAADPLV